MNKKITIWLLILFLAAIQAKNLFPAQASETIQIHENNDVLKNNLKKDKGFIDGEIIIKYKESKANLKKSSGEKRASELETSKSLNKIDEIKNSNLRVVKTEKDVLQTIEELSKDPSVEYAQPNYKKYLTTTTANDPGFSSQWNLSKIQSSLAWDIEQADNYDQIVAVIDTGVYYNHVDLSQNMWDGSSFCISDQNLLIPEGCPNHGWDYKSNDNNPIAEPWFIDSSDEGAHGTWASGVIAATSNNATGISGLSRYNNIKIMALRFDLDSVSEIKAINFAKANGAKVINASFGGSYFDQAEKDAISNFPGIFVAAAGNEASNNDQYPVYPASYDNANIISVASSDQNDVISTFSNYGQTSVDLAAPGESIPTTYYDSITNYASVSGTSFSAPMVSGAVALLASKNTDLTNAQLKYDILNSGDSISGLATKTVSGKRLNLFNAYQLANKVSAPTPSIAGGTYTSTQSVILSSATAGASIYYTLDGTLPSASSTSYSSPISISSTTTLKAVAIKSGLADSDISNLTYTFELPSPIYRFWSDQKQGHFFTISPVEKDSIIANDKSWRYEGVAYNTFKESSTGISPIYRFWSDSKQHHFYTISLAERDSIIANDKSWNYEGIAYYAYGTQQSNATAVYRFWSDSRQGHFFTISAAEKNSIIANDKSWRYEGVAWYVPTN